MIARAVITLVAAAGLLGLGACSEKPQVASSAAKKSDQPAWKGASDPYVVSGWTAGDKDSWTNQIRQRNQSQNEYNRSPAAPVNGK